MMNEKDGLMRKDNMIIYFLVCYLLPLLLASPFLLSASSDAHVIVIAFVLTGLLVFKTSSHHGGRFVSFLTVLVSMLILGLMIWCIESIRQAIWGKVEPYFIYSFIATFVVGSLSCLVEGYKNNKISREKYSIIIGCLAVVCFVVILLIKRAGVDSHIPFIDSPIVFGCIVGFSAGCFLYLATYRLIFPCINQFSHMIDYLVIMILPAAAFFIGYFVIALVFSGFYAVIEQFLPGSFAYSNGQIPFNDYLYFSIMTISTLGDANISAIGLVVRWVEILELIVGLIWVTVVLAATLGFVQEKFNVIANSRK